MAQSRGSLSVLLLYLNLLLLLATLASCLPNIRIQVNNENYQSPPYLLEAIKQAELASSSSPSSSRNHHQQQQQQSQQQSAAVASVSEQHDANEFPQSAANVVKEESIEEILDLDPDSVLRLSPESFINNLSPEDYSHLVTGEKANVDDHSPPVGGAGGLVESSDSHIVNYPISLGLTSGNSGDETNVNKGSEDQVVSSADVASSSNDNNNQHTHHPTRKPQLPVTNAHLKRPAEVIIDDDDLSIKPKAAASSSSSNLTNKVASPPDVWAPELISEITNASAVVPPVITKEYGFNSTRTRVTLGGGYVRDRLPPLVNSSSSSFNDDKPEKPVAPLEKPFRQPVQRPPPPNQVMETKPDRIIEVPERIIMDMNGNGIPPKQQKRDESKLVVVIKEESSNNDKSTNLPIGKPDSRCPGKGVMTFDHPTACDRYFYCEDGYMSEETCPNGLMYGTRDTVKDFCVHRWKADCGDRSIPNPISSPGCRWQYGIFNVQGSPKCSPDYYECEAGKFEVKKCPSDGQIYDDRTKSCKFAELVGCANEALADFHCPQDDQANTYWPFPRYFLSERALIHCVNDKPQIIRCTEDERVDPEHLHCVPLAKLAPVLTPAKLSKKIE